MSTDENQRNPLAPARFYGRSDEEFAPETRRIASPSPTQHGTSKCCVYILLWVVVQAAIALIVALVVFRVETPRLRLGDVAVKSLRYVSSPAPSVNATLVANVTIRNTNFGPYGFENGTSISVLYADRPVGEGIPIEAGRAKARHTEKVNVTIEFGSSWLSSDTASKNLSSDLSSGVLQLSTHASLRGKIKVMGIVRRRTSEMNCTITLNLNSGEVQDVRCK